MNMNDNVIREVEVFRISKKSYPMNGVKIGLSLDR